MGGRGRGRVVAAALAAVALASLAAWLLFRPPRDAGVDADGAREEALDPSPPSLATAAPSPAPPAEGASRDVASAPSPTTVRVLGSVTLPERARVRGGVAWVTGVERNREVVLARAGLAPDGTFDLSFPYAGGDRAWPLRVVAAPLDWPRVDRHVEARSGETTHVDLSIADPGRSIIGRVVAAGRPLPDLRFGLARIPRLSLVDWTDDLGPLRDEHVGAVTVTDDHGGFAFHGLPDVRAYPVSFDPLWSLAWAGASVEDPGVGGTQTQDIRASPGCALEGTVVDARTGAPLEPVTWWIEIEGSHSEAHGGSPSAFSFRQAAPDEGRSAFRVSAQFAADGYRGFATSVEFPAGGGVKRLDVRLEPLREDEVGTVWLESGLRDERGQDVPISVGRFVTKGRATIGTMVEVGPAQGGAVPVRLPSGTSTISITPQSPFGKLMEWKGEVVVPGGRESRFPVPWAPHGSLVVTSRATGAGADANRMYVMLREVGGTRGDSADRRAPDGRLHAPAVPVGAWHVAHVVPRNVPERVVRIERGSTASVTLGD